MQAEIQIKFSDIDHTINLLKKHVNWENSLIRVREFNTLVESQSFWEDTIKAQLIMKEKKQLEKAIDQIDAFPLILFTLRFKERPWPIDMAGAQIACGGHCVIPDITLMEATDEMCGTVCTATCFIGAEKALKMTTF